MEVYNLSEHMRQIAASFEGVAKRKHINMVFESNPDNVEWRLDHSLIEQIVENLVSNSVKFSPVKKDVTLSVVEKENRVQIRIADQGPGIHPDELHKLFQKYQRLSNKPTGGESSTGLGLSIVKKYVEGMGGKVWCESEWGKGATFVVEFPRETTKATIIESEDA
jgi:signal transduction histidine kinase